MGRFDFIRNKTEYRNLKALGPAHEFCPRCEANITMQKGYSNDLPYWICKGCGEMLINPALPGDIAWICDGCGEMLNIQEGFSEECGAWKCFQCGYENKIDKSEIYLSEEEFQSDFYSPYKGLSDEDILALSLYSEEKPIYNRNNIILVRNMTDNELYVKKILSTYDASVYGFLMEHPIKYMPKICEVYESNNNLIVIEEFIEGRTLADIIDDGPLDLAQAVGIVRRICMIAKNLHDLDNPIIHRDIKPSNIIIKNDGEAYLLDINVAKWYKADEIEDTMLLGTRYFAAPEQLGYGFSASSYKADIYAMGMLLNVMVTGKMPKEEKAPEPIWSVVEKCIKLEPENRYTDQELLDVLDVILE